MGIKKAKLVIEDVPEPLEVMFNPESYNLSFSAAYSEKKVAGLDGPISQYIAGDSQTLDMTLYFDTYKPPTLASPQEGRDGCHEADQKTGRSRIYQGFVTPPAQGDL